jgi:cytochrome bd ubiquinol oxidase subunit I
MWIVFVLTPLQMVLGDMHGATRLSINRWRWERWKETGRETGRSQPLTLFAWPDEAAERNEFLLAIPPLGRLILSHDRNGEVDWPAPL